MSWAAARNLLSNDYTAQGRRIQTCEAFDTVAGCILFLPFDPLRSSQRVVWESLGADVAITYPSAVPRVAGDWSRQDMYPTMTLPLLGGALFFRAVVPLLLDDALTKPVG